MLIEIDVICFEAMASFSFIHDQNRSLGANIEERSLLLVINSVVHLLLMHRVQHLSSYVAIPLRL